MLWSGFCHASFPGEQSNNEPPYSLLEKNVGVSGLCPPGLVVNNGLPLVFGHAQRVTHEAIDKTIDRFALLFCVGIKVCTSTLGDSDFDFVVVGSHVLGYNTMCLVS